MKYKHALKFNSFPSQPWKFHFNTIRWGLYLLRSLQYHVVIYYGVKLNDIVYIQYYVLSWLHLISKVTSKTITGLHKTNCTSADYSYGNYVYVIVGWFWSKFECISYRYKSPIYRMVGMVSMSIFLFFLKTTKKLVLDWLYVCKFKLL